jgi:hypothetical protein
MNCLEFRRIVGAEPSTQPPQLLAHMAECAACARHREELLRMDQLIYRALDLEMDTQETRGSTSRREMPRWVVAAGIVAACVLSLFVWLSVPRGALAEQLVAHVEHEAQSLVETSDVVEPQRLHQVLSRSGVRLAPGVATVSYAMSCWFRGQYVPHLVVQTERGPVTVLLLTQEQDVKGRQEFDEGGFHGVVVPAPRGALAVLGRDAYAEEAAERFLGAVEYAP